MRLGYSGFLFLFILLVGCQGSENYRGCWKSMNRYGEKSEICFEAKKFSVTNEELEKQEFAYKQTAIKINDGIKTYEIKFTDGREARIRFPIPKNYEMAIILDANNRILFTLGRTEYLTYDDIYDFTK